MTLQCTPVTLSVRFTVVNMQTIEGLWMQAKRKLRYQSGTRSALFASYLCAFQWRFCHKRHVFGQYLKLISDNYNI